MNIDLLYSRSTKIANETDLRNSKLTGGYIYLASVTDGTGFYFGYRQRGENDNAPGLIISNIGIVWKKQAIYFDQVDITATSAATVTGAQASITSLGGLTTPLTTGEGGTGNATGDIASDVNVVATHTIVFTASTTWTVPINVGSIIIIGTGGGGGGGASLSGDGGGGGGGAAQSTFFTSYTVTAGDVLGITIGAGGAGGVTGGAAATAGTDTILADNTTSTTIATLVAGGLGGYGNTAGIIGGGTGYPNGWNGWWDSANAVSHGGAGGSSAFGTGGMGTVGSAGGHIGFVGAGGAGAAAGNDGGDGGAGILILQW